MFRRIVKKSLFILEILRLELLLIFGETRNIYIRSRYFSRVMFAQYGNVFTYYENLSKNIILT